MEHTGTEVTIYHQAPHRRTSNPTSRKVMPLVWGYLCVVGVAVVVFAGLYAEDKGLAVATAYITLIFMVAGGVFFCPWLRRALRYEIRGDSITIVRAWPFTSIRIPFGDIRSISRPVLEKPGLHFDLEAGRCQQMGSPTVKMPGGKGTVVIGPGIHNYWVGAHGIRLRAWVTSAQRLVAIECEDRSYLISPEHPDEFVRDIRVMI